MQPAVTHPPAPRMALLSCYVGVVALVALLITGATGAVAWSDDPSTTTVFHAIALGAMVAGARHFPIHLSPASKVFVDTAALFAAVLLLPAPLAIAAVGGGIIIGEAIRRGHPLQFVFGVSETLIGVSTAALLYHLLQPGGFGEGSSAAIDLFAVVASALVVYFLNIVLVDTVVALTIGVGSIRWSLNRHRIDLPHQAALYLLGFFAALTAYHYPLTLVFLVVPAAVVYISLRDGQHLRRGAQQTMESLADIVDLRDHYTYEHSTRVAVLARTIAVEMRLSPEEIESVYLGARIHDVGKIGIKGQILLKEGPLSDDDWREMKTHPEVGARLVSRFPDYTSAARLVLAHHERFDGRGYPQGLAGDQIPIGARIISVADCFDAMTSKRPYREALEAAAAVTEIERNAGKQFDPACVAGLIKVLVKEGKIELETAPRATLRVAAQAQT